MTDIIVRVLVNGTPLMFDGHIEEVSRNIMSGESTVKLLTQL